MDIPEKLKENLIADVENIAGLTLSEDTVIALKRCFEISVGCFYPSVPYQKCPKCDGQGSVSKPPYVPGDVNHWSSTSSTFTCDVCNGQKIIPQFTPQYIDVKKEWYGKLTKKLEKIKTGELKLDDYIAEVNEKLK